MQIEQYEMFTKELKELCLKEEENEIKLTRFGFLLVFAYAVGFIFTLRGHKGLNNG